MKMLGLTTGLLLGTIALALDASASELKVQEKAPPTQVDPAIRKLLQGKSIQLAPFEFWLVSELQLPAKATEPGKALDSLQQATILGVVSIEKATRDYRDDEIPAGIYTMRLILQPQDGNHLGTSEFPQFAALTPAKADTKPEGITDYKSLVKASSKETATDHPVILSLRPVNSAPSDMPTIEEPAPEHKSVRVKIPASARGEKTEIAFDIVYEGKGHK